ncbi:hypothetical protein WH47_02592, partial [Habropoda laboriosa]
GELSSWGSIGEGSGNLGDWGGIGDWCSCEFGHRGGVGDWSGGEFSNWSSGDLGYWRGNERSGGCFFTNDSVESVNWIGGVVNDTSGSVSLEEGVAALNYVSVTGFLLALGIAGKAVVHIVSVAVLRMGVVFVVHCLSHYRFGHWSNHSLSQWSSYCHWGRVSQMRGWCVG